MNVKDWLIYAQKKISHICSSKYDVEILLSYVLKRSKVWLILFENTELTLAQFFELENLINRRSNSEPIAYIIEQWEFWSIELIISPSVLIPRPETEILVEQALLRLDANSAILLDLGTGCGAIALALATERLNCYVVGIDCNKEAIFLARKNAKNLDLNNTTFFYSDWFSLITKKFDIIVSNPPYVSFQDMKLLEKDIFFEPYNSLFSKKNGLQDIEYIISKAGLYLKHRGWLLIEHSWKQRQIVTSLFKLHKFVKIQSYKDYGGNDRVTVGQYIF